jgi:hypothetical protein
MKHEIRVKLPPAEVLNRDVTFVIREDGRKLGELKVSRGALEWKPRNQQRHFRCRWRDFAEFMEG